MKTCTYDLDPRQEEQIYLDLFKSEGVRTNVTLCR